MRAVHLARDERDAFMKQYLRMKREARHESDDRKKDKKANEMNSTTSPHKSS